MIGTGESHSQEQIRSIVLKHQLPSAAPEGVTAAQLALRQKTGGFNLVFAKEVQPGLLVFRLRDDTPAGGDVFGTLLRPDPNLPVIASFSLCAIVPPVWMRRRLDLGAESRNAEPAAAKEVERHRRTTDFVQWRPKAQGFSTSALMISH